MPKRLSRAMIALLLFAVLGSGACAGKPPKPVVIYKPTPCPQQKYDVLPGSKDVVPKPNQPWPAVRRNEKMLHARLRKCEAAFEDCKRVDQACRDALNEHE